MVSPFYLGSNPADDVGGQYPGKAISGGGSRFTPPPEFVDLTADFDMLWDKATGGLDTTVGGLPRLYIEEQKKSWRSLFKVAGGFDDNYSESDPYARELSGDAEQFYKASDFEIDLIKVFTDPVSQLKDIKSAAFNMSDLRKEGRDRLMQALVFGEHTSPNGSFSDTLLNATINSFGDRFEAASMRSGMGGGKIELNLFAHDPKLVAAYQLANPTASPQALNSASTIYHEELVDTLKSKSPIGSPQDRRISRQDSRSLLGQSYIAYTRVEDAETKNTLFYRNFVGQAGSSMEDIFKSTTPAGAQRLPELIHEAAQNATQGAPVGSLQYAQAVAQLTDGHVRFSAMNTMNSAALGFFAGPASPGMSSTIALTKLEAARVIPGIPGVPINVGSIASQKEFDTARKNLTTAGKSLAEMAYNVEQVKTSYSGNTFVSAPERARVLKWTTKMDAEISRLAKLADPNATSSSLAVLHAQTLGPGGNSTGLNAFATAFGSVVDDTKKRRALSSGLTRFSKRLGGYDVFNTGLNTELAKIFVDHHIIPGRGVDPLSAAGYIASQTQFGKQIRLYSLAARDSYKFNYYNNLYAKIQGGKLTPTLFKSRFINSLPNYTPHTIVRNFLTANSYFGLRVDKITYNNYVDWVAGGKVGHFSGFYKPGNAFVYRMTQSKTFGALFENRFNIDLGGTLGTFSVKGGSHLLGVGVLNKFRQYKDHDFSEFLTQNVTGKNKDAFFNQLRKYTAQGVSEKNAFILLMLNTNNEALFKARFGHIPFAKPDAVFKQMQDFKAWLRANNFDVFDSNGNIDVAKIGNLDLLLQWFHNRSLNPSYLDFTRSAVGLVEKLTERLNVLQDKVYNLQFRGFKFGRLFFWQQQATSIIYNKLLSLVTKIGTKLFAGAAGAATGGIALLLAPVAEKLVYYVATSIVGKFSKAFSGILKGDFTALGIAIQESMAALIKIFAYTTLGLALLLILPFGFLQFIISNMSPRAPWAYNNLQAGLVSVVPGGPITPGACADLKLVQGSCSITEISYDGLDDIHPTAARGHGSEKYWDIILKDNPDLECNITVPIIDGRGALGPTESLDNKNGDTIDNRCSPSRNPSLGAYSEVYGRAMDAVGPVDNAVVCAPAMPGVSYWVLGQGTSVGNDSGTQMNISGYGPTDNLLYVMKLLHITEQGAHGTRAAPGDGIARIFVGGRFAPHVHVELQDAATGDVIAPETTGICL